MRVQGDLYGRRACAEPAHAGGAGRSARRRRIRQGAGPARAAPAKPSHFLNRAVELQSNDWTLYSALGVAYDETNDPARRARPYQRALALKPGEAGGAQQFRHVADDGGRSCRRPEADRRRPPPRTRRSQDRAQSGADRRAWRRQPQPAGRCDARPQACRDPSKARGRRRSRRPSRARPPPSAATTKPDRQTVMMQAVPCRSAGRAGRHAQPHKPVAKRKPRRDKLAAKPHKDTGRDRQELRSRRSGWRTTSP